MKRKAGAKVTIVNGICYPRIVPLMAGLPSGWQAVEQVYGPGTKSHGKTYIRYHRMNQKNSKAMSPKQVIQIHCEENGIPWEPQYQKYCDAMQAKNNGGKVQPANAITQLDP